MSKLSLSQAWDETMAVLARDGRLFLAVALALLVLPGLIFDVTVPDAQPGQFPPPGPWVAVAGVALLVSLVGQLAIIRLAIGPHIAVGEAIVRALRRLVPYVIAVIVWLVPLVVTCSLLYAMLVLNQAHPSIPVALALFVLTLVGVYLAVRLMLSSAVASAEDVSPFAILRRSWQLSAGSWWRLFVFLFLFGIGAACLLWAVESVAGLLVHLVADDSGPRSIGGLVVAIARQVVSAFLSVTFFVLLARIYVQRSTADIQSSVPTSGT